MKKFLCILVLLASCAVVPTRQNLLANVVACTNTQVEQVIRDTAVTCLLESKSDNYAACLTPLAVSWTQEKIECVAAYYEQSQKKVSSQ